MKEKNKVKIIGVLCIKYNKDIPLENFIECWEKKSCPFKSFEPEECLMQKSLYPSVKIKIKCD